MRTRTLDEAIDAVSNVYCPHTVELTAGCGTLMPSRAKAGEYVTEVTAIGPLGLKYLDPDDDPRPQNRQ
jgi:hypothetical protein